MEFIRKAQAQKEAAEAAKLMKATERNILEAQAVQPQINAIHTIGTLIKDFNQKSKNERISKRLRNTAKSYKNEGMNILRKKKNNLNQRIQTLKQGNQSKNITRRKLQVFSNVSDAIDKELISIKIQNEKSKLLKAAALFQTTNTLEELDEELNNTAGAGSGPTKGGKRRKSRKVSRKSRRRRLAGRR